MTEQVLADESTPIVASNAGGGGVATSAEHQVDGEPKTAAIFGQLATTNATPVAPQDIELVLDIPVQLTVELGRTKVPIRQILRLAQGSVVELNGLAGEPLDVLINGCLIAQGEVVVVNAKFGIRLTDIITPSERIRKLKR